MASIERRVQLFCLATLLSSGWGAGLQAQENVPVVVAAPSPVAEPSQATAPASNVACQPDCAHCRPLAAAHAFWKKLVGPPRHVPAPNGTYLNGWNAAQVALAEQSEFTFFGDEWYQGGGELGPAGREHLQTLAARLQHDVRPVVVEPAAIEIGPDDSLKTALQRATQLNVVRRQVIVEGLLGAGINNADELVHVQRPIAEGLDANEAPQIYRGQVSGAAGGNSGQTSGGFGGSGMGGASGNLGSGFGGR